MKHTNDLADNPSYQLQELQYDAGEREQARYDQYIETQEFNEEQEAANAPSGGEMAAAAFRVDNEAVAFFSSAKAFSYREPVEGFRAVDNLEGYEDVAEAFTGVFDPVTMEEVKQDIDQFRKDRQTLQQGDWRGTGFQMLAGATAPANLALMGVTMGASAAGSVLRSAAQNVAVGLVATGASEAALHQLQVEREAEETVAATLGTLIIDGIVGGVAGRLSRNSIQGLHNQVTNQIKSGKIPDEVAVALRAEIDAEDAAGKGFGTMDAGAAETRLNESTAELRESRALWKYSGVDWVARQAARITPNFRMATSNEAMTRQTSQGISELDFQTVGNQGSTAAETLIKLDQRKMSAHIVDVRKAYQASGLEEQTFKDQWSAIMRYGDTLTPRHQAMGIEELSPDVVAIANKSRTEMYDKMWARATEAGVEGTYYQKPFSQLTEEELSMTRPDGSKWVDEAMDYGDNELVKLPVSQDTAPAYLQRWYDQDRIRQDPAGFATAVRQGLEDQQIRANAELDAQRADILAENVDEAAGDAKLVDTYERTQAANEVAYKEAAATYPAAKADVDGQMRGAIDDINQTEIEELANAGQAKADIDIEIKGLQDSIGAIKRKTDGRIKQTKKSADRQKLRNLRKQQVDEAQDAIKELRASKTRYSETQIKKDAALTRNKIKADAEDMLTQLRKERDALKRSRGTVPLDEYRASKARLADLEARVNEIESQRPKEYADEDWAQITSDYTNTVLGMKAGEFHSASMQPSGNGEVNPFKHRVDIKDEFLDAFLVKDPEKMLTHMTNALSPKVRLSEAFGGNEGDYLLNGRLEKIDQAYAAKMQAARDAGDIKGTEALEKQRARDIDDVTGVRDRLLNMVATSNPKHRWLTSGLRSARNLSVATKLGKVAAAAIPDMARQLTYKHAGKYAESFAKAIKHIGLENLPAHQQARIASAAVRVQNNRIADMMEYDDMTPMTRTEGFTKWAAHQTVKLSGLQHLDTLNKTISGYMVSDDIVNVLIKGGTKKEMNVLGQLGIRDSVADNIRYFANRYAVKEGDLYNPRVDLWQPDDVIGRNAARQAQEAFEGAIIKETDRLTMTPGVGDKPLLMDGETAKTLLQFKSFIIGAVNRITIPLMQEEGIRPFIEIIVATGLGTLAYTARELAVGRKPTTDGIVLDSMDRAGYTGTLLELWHMGNKLTGATEGTSRYRSRGVTGMIAGPVGGMIEDAAKLAHTGTSVDSKVHAGRRLLPFQNLMWLDWAWTQLEGQTAKALGGTGRYAEPKQIGTPTSDIGF